MAKPVKFAVRERKFRDQLGMVGGEAGLGHQEDRDIGLLHLQRPGPAGAGEQAWPHRAGDGLHWRRRATKAAALAPALAVVLLAWHPGALLAAGGVGLAPLEGVEH